MLRPLSCFGRAHARIDEEVDDVDEDVHGDEHEGVHDHHAGHERHVAHADGLVEQKADPGPAEHDLDDDGAADQAAELEPDDGGDRDRGVGHEGIGYNAATRQALGYGGRDG